MMPKFEQVRFFLFTHSYPGEIIATHLRKRNASTRRVLKKEIGFLANALRFDKTRLERFVLSNRHPRIKISSLASDAKIYFLIEKELKLLVAEKLDEYSTAREDYQRQLLLPAIERVAGNSLANVKNDRRFERRLKNKMGLYGKTYYKIAYEYKLPTIRIAPFLMRLISD